MDARRAQPYSSRMTRRRGHALTRRRALAVLGGAALVTACGQRAATGSGAFLPAGTPAPAGAAPGTAWKTVQPVDFSARFAAFPVADEPNADPAKVVWPDFVQRAPGDVKKLYEFQLVNGELMRYM